MKERPILMSGPMVLRTLDGSKTQTRRIAKFPEWFLDEYAQYGRHEIQSEIDCPFGRPGDRIWVKETFIHEPADYCWEASVSIPVRPAHTVYRADTDPTGQTKGVGWRPSIHMPRSLSRLSMIVDSVRVERVQDISEEDAKAEGMPWNEVGMFTREWCSTCEGSGKVVRWQSMEQVAEDCQRD